MKLIVRFSVLLLLIAFVSCQTKEVKPTAESNQGVKLILDNGFTILDTFPSGTAHTTFRVLEDTSHLEIEIYHPNGSISMRGQTVNGQRDGEWFAYDKENRLLTIGTYKLGLDHGLKTVYYPTGQKYYQGNFADGKKVGEWVFWDENGKIVQKQDFGK